MIQPVALPEGPRRLTTKEHWREVADSARAHPGEWIPAGEFPAMYVTRINQGKNPAFRDFGFTARGIGVHTVGNTPHVAIFVRYEPAPVPTHAATD